MAYTIQLIVFDRGDLYTAGFPAFSGVLTNMPPITTLVATTTPKSLTLSYPSAPDPPGTLGLLHVTDPTGPGDFFRSGPITAWPPSPALLQVGTGRVGIPFERIRIPIPPPITINLPGHVAAIVGAATSGMFIPFKLTIQRLKLGSSPTAGAIRARFSGKIWYTTLILPRKTDFSGTVDLTLTPSGDAATPTTFVNVTASNLSLSPDFITPLSTGALAALAPAFSDTLSGPLTTRINSTISDLAASVRMSVPLTPSGLPLFSPAATISVRRIAVVRSGLVVDAVLGELTATPASPPDPAPEPEPEPEARPQLLVRIEPQPEEEVTQTYMVSVRNAADGSPLKDATITITTFTPVIGNTVTASALTDVQGLAALEVTLRSRFRPSSDPTHTGELQRTPPTLLVTKQGFEDFLLKL
ncbi:hypothetical protein [Nonomuraea sp. JJY05]|uniref:hypothetical protein n=1 Tax=Nonomuraea sp. JJY05 TaxID=3350255 RepID=UPI00373EC507